jgi:hypothetical protein
MFKIKSLSEETEFPLILNDLPCHVKTNPSAFYWGSVTKF